MKKTAIKTIYSFDVFDTLIVRNCVRPEEIFRRTAEHVLTELGLELAKNVPAFVALRIRAEREARKQSHEGEATFNEIYANLLSYPEVQAMHLRVDPFRKQEIEEELASVYPVTTMQRKVKALLDAGEQVIYLSDMYLPAAVIQQMLERCGYPVKNNLYVSNTYGLNKYYGRLYPHVLEILKVRGPALLHTGDKWRADFLMARLHKVRARFDPTATMTRYEKRWLEFGPLTPNESLAGAMRVARVAADFPDVPASPMVLYANIAAPLLIGFVAWTLQQARERGIQRLYFVARDGFLLREIAQTLIGEGDGPEIKYLYGSRQAWLLAGTPALTREGLGWMIIQGASTRLADILKRAHLLYSDLAEAWKNAGLDSADQILNAREIEIFWQVLLSPPGLALLKERQASQRSQLQTYLIQEGFTDGTPSALVDIGWRLQAQQALKVVMEGQGIPLGIYLGRNANHLKEEAAGPSISWINEGKSDPEARLTGALFQNAMIVEQLLTPAPHGSTRGYIKQGEGMKPIVGSPSGLIDREQFHCIHLCYRDLTQVCKDYLKTPEALAAWRTTALLNFFEFFMRPQLSEAQMMRSFGVSDDQNEARKISVAAPIRARDVGAYFWKNGLHRGRRGFFRRNFIWLGGSARLSAWPVRAFFRITVLLGLYGSKFR